MISFVLKSPAPQIVRSTSVQSQNPRRNPTFSSASSFRRGPISYHFSTRISTVEIGSGYQLPGSTSAAINLPLEKKPEENERTASMRLEMQSLLWKIVISTYAKTSMIRLAPGSQPPGLQDDWGLVKRYADIIIKDVLSDPNQSDFKYHLWVNLLRNEESQTQVGDRSLDVFSKLVDRQSSLRNQMFSDRDNTLRSVLAANIEFHSVPAVDESHVPESIEDIIIDILSIIIEETENTSDSDDLLEDIIEQTRRYPEGIKPPEIQNESEEDDIENSDKIEVEDISLENDDSLEAYSVQALTPPNPRDRGSSEDASQIGISLGKTAVVAGGNVFQPIDKVGEVSAGEEKTDSSRVLDFFERVSLERTFPTRHFTSGSERIIYTQLSSQDEIEKLNLEGFEEGDKVLVQIASPVRTDSSSVAARRYQYVLLDPSSDDHPIIFNFDVVVRVIDGFPRFKILNLTSQNTDQAETILSSWLLEMSRYFEGAMVRDHTQDSELEIDSTYNYENGSPELLVDRRLTLEQIQERLNEIESLLDINTFSPEYAFLMIRKFEEVYFGLYNLIYETGGLDNDLLDGLADRFIELFNKFKVLYGDSDPIRSLIASLAQSNPGQYTLFYDPDNPNEFQEYVDQDLPRTSPMGVPMSRLEDYDRLLRWIAEHSSGKYLVTGSNQLQIEVTNNNGETHLDHYRDVPWIINADGELEFGIVSVYLKFLRIEIKHKPLNNGNYQLMINFNDPDIELNLSLLDLSR